MDLIIPVLSKTISTSNKEQNQLCSLIPSHFLTQEGFHLMNRTTLPLKTTKIILFLTHVLIIYCIQIQLPSAVAVFSSPSSSTIHICRDQPHRESCSFNYSPYEFHSFTSRSPRMIPSKMISTGNQLSGITTCHRLFNGGGEKLKRTIVNRFALNSYSGQRERRTFFHRHQQKHHLAFVCTSNHKRTRTASYTTCTITAAESSSLSTSSCFFKQIYKINQRKKYYQTFHLFSSSSRNNLTNEDDTTADNKNDNKKLNNETDEYISRKTKTWIQNVVIGLNLCPFADKPKQQSKLHTVIYRGSELEDIVSSVLYECILRQDDMGSTTVVVCPDVYPDDFDKYLDVLSVLNEILEDYNLMDDIQVCNT